MQAANAWADACDKSWRLRHTAPQTRGMNCNTHPIRAAAAAASGSAPARPARRLRFLLRLLQLWGPPCKGVLSPPVGRRLPVSCRFPGCRGPPSRPVPACRLLVCEPACRRPVSGPRPIRHPLLLLLRRRRRRCRCCHSATPGSGRLRLRLSCRQLKQVGGVAETVGPRRSLGRLRDRCRRALRRVERCLQHTIIERISRGQQLTALCACSRRIAIRPDCLAICKTADECAEKAGQSLPQCHSTGSLVLFEGGPVDLAEGAAHVAGLQGGLRRVHWATVTSAGGCAPLDWRRASAPLNSVPGHYPGTLSQ